MFNRKTYLADNWTLGDAGTRTFDLNVTDPISVLWIKFQATNGGTSNRVNTLGECISAVEIIDGADVLYSLTGAQALALACYQYGALPRQVVPETPDSPFTYNLPILFGRYPGDTEYALDPSRFTNPQVRVTWNLAAIRAVGATGFLTGTLQVSIIANVMEGVSNPTHFLMAKQHYTWTSVAAGTEYIDLPTDYPYRAAIFRGVKWANPWHWMWDQIRINCDGGKFIAMNERGWDLINELSALQGRFHYRHDFYAGNGVVLATLLGESESLSLLPSVIVDCVPEYSSTGAGGGSLQVRTAGALDAALRHWIGDVSGWNPYDCVYYPFGRQDTPAEWFPSGAFKGVKLEVRGGVADALMSVCLVQDRAY